jgi:hypothetical protein
MYRYRSVLLFVAAVLVCSACQDSTPTIVTNPTVCPCTDSFSGTLSINGAFTHTFTTTTLGSVSTTLVSLAPDATQIVGFGLGVWNGSSCTVASSSDVATTGSSITLNASAAGTLCVRLYDVGFITTPVLYQLTVTHP